jgi:hypothetical protein
MPQGGQSFAGDVGSAMDAMGQQFGFQVTSGFRTPAENAALPGHAENSLHMQDKARDYSIRGQSPQQVQQFVDYLNANGFRAAVTNRGTGPHIHAEYRGGGAPSMVPTQLQPAPKPSETTGPKAPSGYRWNADETALEPIPGGPAQVAIEAKQAALDAKAEAGKVRQAESATAASQLVAAIDTLTASPGFSDLGTEWGDVKIGTPIIRNDAKDADAQLKNVAGQVALATMARLKALSAVGATGFGALTAPELKLLQNSIAALQAEDISNAELKRSLKNIRDTMQKVADWNEPAASPTPPAPASPKTAPKPGDREDGYMFKGGNPSDPRNWVKASR